MLESFEAGRSRELWVGLDRAGDVAWRLTGEALLGRLGGWQARLRTLGARPGDRVAIDVPRGPDLLPAHVAALASGATLVPLNPALAPEERARTLERAAPRVVLGPEHAPDGPAAPSLAERAAETPALLIFTSGTTGDPKGVPHLEAGLEANLAGLAEVWALSAADRLLHVLPAHHVHGLVLALYGSARLGAPIVMLERFDADLCLGALGVHGITVLMGVPTMYHRMARSPVEADASHMRLWVSGSAALAAEEFGRFERRFGLAPVERYGLTETLIATSNRLDAPRPGVVGFPLPGTEIRLAEDGEVEIRGPGVMKGYWGSPEPGREAFHDGFFRSGDLGRIEPDGALAIAGRKKELIIVGGSNVLPGEVERALLGDPDVHELAVAGLPDADRGEVVTAFVVARAGTSERDLEARLRELAGAGLASYKRPRDYRFVPELPRNSMGKIDRRALTDRGRSAPR
jgi:acyl-CoA synthetase (AMP-forming)/AMP-acid ligase II